MARGANLQTWLFPEHPLSGSCYPAIDLRASPRFAIHANFVNIRMAQLKSILVLAL
jgi:hypothetical protein